MDINKTLQELYAEKRRLDNAIAALEEHLLGLSRTAVRPHRGRRKMSPEERLEVSRRMSKYWEARKAKSSEVQPDQPAEGSTVTATG